MNTISIIRHDSGNITVAEEPMLGNPVLTPCKNMKEMAEVLSQLTGTDISYYDSVVDWNIELSQKARIAI